MALYKHQQICLDKMQGKRGFGLFFKQGHGKTFTVLSEFQNSEAQTMLVLVYPNGVLDAWKQQLKKHNIDAKIFVWHNNKAKQRQKDYDEWLEYAGKKIAVFPIAPFSAKTWKGFDYLGALLNQHNDITLILDQSQCIKNPESRITQRAIKLRNHASINLVRILEGSWHGQGNQDVYAQMLFLHDDIVQGMTYPQFINKFCNIGTIEVPLPYYKMIDGVRVRVTKKVNKIIGDKNSDEMMNMMSKYIHITNDADVVDMPDLIENFIPVDMTDKEQKIYHDIISCKIPNGLPPDVVDMFVNNNINLDTLKHRMVLITRLHQFSAGCFMEVSKNTACVDLLNHIIPTDTQTVVFCVYENEVKRLHQLLTKHNITNDIYYGKVNAHTRSKTIERFYKGDFRVLIGTPATMGVGLDFQNATSMIFHSNGYSYIDRQESMARIQRMGSKSDRVVCYDLSLGAKGIDKTILTRLADKKDMTTTCLNVYEDIMHAAC